MAYTPTYDANAINLLAKKTEYEDWLLEEVYTLDPKPSSSNSYPFVYLVDSLEPKFAPHLEGAANLFVDWRSSFLAVGTQLVFVVTFKLLDMFIEWVIEMNGLDTDKEYRTFTAKNNELRKKKLIFPDFVQTRPWLEERLIALYETLTPFRSVIIHRKDFKLEVDGSLVINHIDKKTGQIKTININPTELELLTLTLVSVVRYVSSTWHIDPFQEKLLRYNLDNLVKFHGVMPALGQRQPLYTKVRLFSQGTDIYHIDTFKIHRDIVKYCPDKDCIFDLQVLIVREGVAVDAFYFPCTDLEKGYPEWRSNIKIDDFRVEIPSNIAFL